MFSKPRATGDPCSGLVSGVDNSVGRGLCDPNLSLKAAIDGDSLPQLVRDWVGLGGDTSSKGELLEYMAAEPCRARPVPPADMPPAIA